MFRVVSIPGKGKGVVALVDIAKGARILAEGPLFTLPKHGFVAQCERMIAAELGLLKRDQVREYLELHNCFEEHDRLFGIFKTNGLPASSDGERGGLFLQASLFNHDCKPKARSHWNENIKMLTIHAIRNIRPGEEITISYTGDIAPFLERQSALWDLFRFKCTCSLCALPPALRTQSDNRMADIMAQEGLLKEGLLKDAEDAHAPLSVILPCIRDTLSLMDVEGITEDYAVRMYDYARSFAWTHRDFPRGQIFLDRRRRLLSLAGGEDSPGLQSLSADVREYEGVLARVYQPYVPSHFAFDMFEAWLWMLERP